MKTPLACLSLVLALVSTAGAQVHAPAVCTPGVTPFVPVFSLSSTVGVLADYTLFCTNSGLSGTPIAHLTFDYFLNTADLNTGSWTLTQGLNSYAGSLTNSNVVEFVNVAYDPTIANLNFEVHGEEVNPSLWGPGFSFFETIGLSGTLSPLINGNPIELVGVNAPAPEPATLSLAAIALGCLLLPRRTRAR